MWTWICTVCGRHFVSDDKAEAQGAFNKHATTEHNAKVVVSIDGSES